jgi:hypothetical protein
MDIVHPWTLDASGQPLLPITTFSIAMIHRQSGGKLPLFVEVRGVNSGTNWYRYVRVCQLLYSVGAARSVVCITSLYRQLMRQAAAVCGGERRQQWYKSMLLCTGVPAVSQC